MIKFKILTEQAFLGRQHSLNPFSKGSYIPVNQFIEEHLKPIINLIDESIDATNILLSNVNIVYMPQSTKNGLIIRIKNLLDALTAIKTNFSIGITYRERNPNISEIQSEAEAADLIKRSRIGLSGLCDRILREVEYIYDTIYNYNRQVDTGSNIIEVLDNFDDKTVALVKKLKGISGWSPSHNPRNNSILGSILSLGFLGVGLSVIVGIARSARILDRSNNYSDYVNSDAMNFSDKLRPPNND